MKTMKHLIPTLFLLWAMNALSQEPAKVNVTKAGTLSTLLTNAQQDTCQHLVVTGKLNSADIKVLRKMAGADGHGSLHILDLKDATLVSSEEPYLTIQKAEEEMFPYITVDVGSMNGSVGHRSTDELGHPLVEIYYSNFILPWDASKKPNAQEISETLSRWKMLKKQKLRTKGHNISQDKNGHFVYSAFTSKNLFCRDMFFRCPNLRLIILPDKRKSYDQVFVLDDPIRYMEQAKALRFK